MEFSNIKRIKLIKRMFSIFGLLLIAAAGTLFILKMNTAGLIVTGVLIGFLLLSGALSLNYVFFSTLNGKIIIRYYPIVSIFGRDYNSIEIPQNILYKFEIKKFIVFKDLTILVKTKQGVAEYPVINLAALSKKEISMIKGELNRILGREIRIEA